MFISTLVLALGTISAAVVLPKVLEGHARKQCLNHDWPAESHAVHMEFCQTYGYPTNWSVNAGSEVQTLRQLLPQSRGIYLHNIMAYNERNRKTNCMPEYSKFRNHMEEPEKGMISREDKDLIVNVGTGAIIGVAAVTIGPSMAVLGGCLWAIDRVRRNT